MQTQRKENRRAMNIIWNAAGDYSFIPHDLLYDETGKAQLFGNYILGAVRRYYDINLLNEFFNELTEDSDADFLKELTWLALENVVYQQGLAERLVLTELRQNYAREYIETHEVTQDSDFLVDLKVVHYQLILGNNPLMSETIRDVLQALDFDKSLTTGQILEKMRAVIEQYFQFNPAKYEKNWISGFQKTKTNFRIASKKKHRSFRFPFMKKPKGDAIDIPEAADSSYVQITKNFMTSYWRRYRNRKQQDQQNYIRNYYGDSLISDSRLKTLETSICTSCHKNSHLHFTRGLVSHPGSLTEHEQAIAEQQRKNRDAFMVNLARNKTSIAKLTSRIKNTMLLDFQFYSDISKAGKMDSGRIWRNLAVEDKHVFVKRGSAEVGGLTVDILLDASASQINRQETISAQAYIIAESLTNCGIPVRVYSFCTKMQFTVITLFRNYDETNNNQKIFNYNATGCNRDGLAIKTAVRMIEETDGEHKLLIVLSDAKPLDTQIINDDSRLLAEHDYTDTPAVLDTAVEVRKGWNQGISVLCVFTGLDEDLPSAKKIYGNNFVRIKSPERFADMVGLLIQNELKNL